MAEYIKDKGERDQFFSDLFKEDVIEGDFGYQDLRVGTFVLVQKEGFPPDEIYMVSKQFDDGTFEIARENMTLDGMKFSVKELKRLSTDEETAKHFRNP